MHWQVSEDVSCAGKQMIKDEGRSLLTVYIVVFIMYWQCEHLSWLNKAGSLPKAPFDCQSCWRIQWHSIKRESARISPPPLCARSLRELEICCTGQWVFMTDIFKMPTQQHQSKQSCWPCFEDQNDTTAQTCRKKIGQAGRDGPPHPYSLHGVQSECVSKGRGYTHELWLNVQTNAYKHSDSIQIFQFSLTSFWNGQRPCRWWYRWTEEAVTCISATHCWECCYINHTHLSFSSMELVWLCFNHFLPFTHTGATILKAALNLLGLNTATCEGELLKETQKHISHISPLYPTPIMASPTLFSCAGGEHSG